MDLLALGNLRTRDRPLSRPCWFVDGELLAADRAS